MLRTAFAIAIALAFVAGLPLAMAASVGGSQESVEAIVKPNFAPISIEDFLRR
jgi:Na+(H+)/acetate symporter ActP